MARKNAGQRRIHLCAHEADGCGALCGANIFLMSLSCEECEGIVCQKCQKALVKLAAKARPESETMHESEAGDTATPEGGGQ